jgi:light-regulated signal transduction histidine kinase (bacteriophytochrome)
MQHSNDIKHDFPDIEYPPGFGLVAGMLTVPLSSEGKDFIVFFRRGVVSEVQWAGNPYANKTEGTGYRPLEPRRSFKIWTEQVTGKSRAWTDEEKETAGVLCLVYGQSLLLVDLVSSLY